MALSAPPIPCNVSEATLKMVDEIVRAHCADKGYKILTFAFDQTFWPRMGDNGEWTGDRDMFIEFPSGNTTQFQITDKASAAGVRIGLERSAAFPFMAVEGQNRHRSELDRIKNRTETL